MTTERPAMSSEKAQRIRVERNMLVVDGELGPEFERAFAAALRALREGNHGQIVLDLSRVPYMSSAFIAPIALTMLEVKEAGRTAVVLAGRKVANLLHLGGLDRFGEIRIICD